MNGMKEIRTQRLILRPFLEKVGFKREAHFRQNIYFHKDENGAPKWKDTYVYALLESDAIF